MSSADSLTLAGAHILLDLLRRHRAGDHARRHRPRQQPAEREVEHAAARSALRSPRSRSTSVQFRSLMTSRRVVAAVGEPRVLRQRLVALIFAAEEAAGERGVGQERHAALAHQRAPGRARSCAPAGCIRPGRSTKAAVPMRVAVSSAADTCGAEKFEQPIARTLPSRHQIVERAQGLLDRRVRIGTVDLIEVDPVGAQPLQARLDGAGMIVAPRCVARSALPIGMPNLVASTTCLAALADRLAEERLGVAVAVDVGGVEQRHAEVERAVHDGAGAGDVWMRPAEVVAAEPDDETSMTGVGRACAFPSTSSLRPLQAPESSAPRRASPPRGRAAARCRPCGRPARRCSWRTRPAR